MSKANGKAFDDSDKSELTTKQAHFVELLISDRKISATEAAAQAYNVANRNVASSIASENLSKPAVISHLSIANDLVEGVLVQSVRDWGESENTRRREIALDAAKYIHDKVNGKATVKVETTAVVTNIAIDLTGGNYGVAPIDQ